MRCRRQGWTPECLEDHGNELGSSKSKVRSHRSRMASSHIVPLRVGYLLGKNNSRLTVRGCHVTQGPAVGWRWGTWRCLALSEHCGQLPSLTWQLPPGSWW